jgi:predicted small lipoprotein YifL
MGTALELNLEVLFSPAQSCHCTRDIRDGAGDAEEHHGDDKHGLGHSRAEQWNNDTASAGLTAPPVIIEHEGVLVVRDDLFRAAPTRPRQSRRHKPAGVGGLVTLSPPLPDMTAPIEEGKLSFLSDLRLARIAAMGALVAALTIAGCGRKGGLDPPPGATAADTSVTRPDLEPAIGPDGRVIAPSQGPKRSTPIDWLLN